MLAKLENLKKLQEAHRSGQGKPKRVSSFLQSEDQHSPEDGKQRKFLPLESTISSRNSQQSKEKTCDQKGPMKMADFDTDLNSLEMTHIKSAATLLTPARNNELKNDA